MQTGLGAWAFAAGPGHGWARETPGPALQAVLSLRVLPAALQWGSHEELGQHVIQCFGWR